MADREKDIRLFERVAQQRLKAAWFLFEDEGKQFNLDAIYLAGYAVECALKAFILKRTPKIEHGAMMERLTEVGALAHDFEYLKGILKHRLQHRPGKDREVFGKLALLLKRVANWSTDLRYQAGLMKSGETAGFLEATEMILGWCLRGRSCSKNRKRERGKRP